MSGQMGRPQKLTAEVARVLVESVAAGMPRRHAAARAGIGLSTFMLWMANGREGISDGPDGANYVELLERIKRAEADAVQRNVVLIQTHARKTWQAAAWWLERRYPADFALRPPGKAGPTPDPVGPGGASGPFDPVVYLPTIDPVPADGPDGPPDREPSNT